VKRSGKIPQLVGANQGIGATTHNQLAG